MKDLSTDIRLAPLERRLPEAQPCLSAYISLRGKDYRILKSLSSIAMPRYATMAP
jgi:hypothetical protein